jgi:hypothetical protein
MKTLVYEKIRTIEKELQKLERQYIGSSKGSAEEANSIAKIDEIFSAVTGTPANEWEESFNQDRIMSQRTEY